MAPASSTATWGVPRSASINHADMICFPLFRGCFPFRPTSKTERMKRTKLPKLLQSPLLMPGMTVLGGCRRWIRKCHISLRLDKQMRDCVRPISIKCHSSHIYRCGAQSNASFLHKGLEISMPATWNPTADGNSRGKSEEAGAAETNESRLKRPPRGMENGLFT